LLISSFQNLQPTLDLLVPKTGTVKDILDELRPKVKLEENGSGQLHLFAVMNSRIAKHFAPDDLIKDASDPSIQLVAEVRSVD
jgi:hypothetical protein